MRVSVCMSLYVCLNVCLSVSECECVSVSGCECVNRNRAGNPFSL